MNLIKRSLDSLCSLEMALTSFEYIGKYDSLKIYF